MNIIKILTIGFLAIGLMACGGAGSATSSGSSRCGSITKNPEITLTVSNEATYEEAMKKDFGTGEGEFQAGKMVNIFVGSGANEKTLEATFVTDKAENVATGMKIPMTAVTKKQGAIATAKMPMSPMKGTYHVELLDGGKLVECRQFTVK